MAEGSADSGSGMTASQGITAGIDATSTILTALGNRRHQRKMAEANREWDLKMWNLQNEYNTPLNQRKRLMAGGYNPQLALPNGANMATLPNSSPEVATPMPQVGGLFDKMYNLANQKKQFELIDAQIAATKAQSALNGVKTTHEAVKEARSASDLNQAQALYNLTIDRAHQAFENEGITKARNQVGLQSDQINLDYLPQKYQQEVAESIQRIRNMQGTATYTDVQAQIAAEKKKWMRMGMTSDDIAKNVNALLSLLKPR